MDSGADLSVFPASSADLRRPPSSSLVAANGSAIRTFGARTVPLNFRGAHFEHEFLVADVRSPILGADFFVKYGYTIDPRNKRIRSLDGRTTISGREDLNFNPRLSLVRSSPFEALFDEFPDLCRPRFNAKVKHNTKHYIPTTGPPVFTPPRRLHDDRLQAAKEEFAKMEAQGVIRRSDSPWASPLHVVPKADGSLRPCGDYRRLNDVTRPDRYPLPHIHDLNSKLHGARIFSVLDLARGYHQVPVAAEDVPKTAIITPFGLFEFLRMPFGLKNAAQAFQRLMDGILRGVDFSFVYLDDILVASPDEKTHMDHLRQVFQLLDHHGLMVNKAKCVLGQGSVKFLGHTVTADGVYPHNDRVEPILQYARPHDKKGVQRFLGLINFYRRFLPKIAEVLVPLTDLTRIKGTNPKVPWTPLCQAAFEEAKRRLASATKLHHPQPRAPTSITTDASEVAVGAELAQRDADGRWRPVAFFSRRLHSAETKYSPFDRELLGVYLTIRHFRHFLEGRPFTIFSDAKGLSTAISSAADKSPRQTRHLSFISEFSTDIQYIAGKDNIVADALSRAFAARLPELDYEDLARQQEASADVQAYRTAVTNMDLRDVQFPGANFTVLCDMGTGKARPIVPPALRRKIFDMVHGLAHVGRRSTQRAMAARFVWHSMQKDITQWCRDCAHCQSSKIARHTRAPLAAREPPQERFHSLHVDLVGPLPESKGHRYLFTIIDRFTKWPEAIPLADATAKSCADALLRHWISRFGAPRDITSDRGTQFTGQLWDQLNQFLGSQPKFTTAYHPQSNGLVERFHRTLKASLRAVCVQDNWYEALPLVMLGLRTAWREGLNHSPAEMLYGSALTLPGEFVHPPRDPHPDPTDFLEQLRQHARQATVVQGTRCMCHRISEHALRSTCELILCAAHSRNPTLALIL